MFYRPDSIKEKLYVVTVISNPIRYRSRWKLYQNFAKHIKDLGGELLTVECSYGDRSDVLVEENLNPQITSPPVTIYGDSLDHKIIHVTTSTNVWIKENLMNIGVQHLPKNWKYVMFADSDIHWARPDIVGETLHQLQFHDVVQAFSECQDLGPNYEPFLRHKGFVYSYMNNYPTPPPNENYYYQDNKTTKGNVITFHPGFAWAWTRKAYESVGGLIDFGILGASDNHMAKALVGDAKYSVHPDMSQAYKDMVSEWEFKALNGIRKNIGFVEGLLLHQFHGAKSLRKYWNRWKILTENKFDPRYDLIKNANGVINLYDRGTDRSARLRANIHAYFKERNEDSIDLPTNENTM